MEDAAAREGISEARIRDIVASRGQDIAAIIIEPIQGEGGDNHFRPEWFAARRHL